MPQSQRDVVATGDFITDALNLFLERLDRVVEALERIAAALETPQESQQ